jgi:hypothetical protein
MKNYLTLLFVGVLLMSCKDEKLEKLEKKSEDLKCKTEFMNSLIGSSENTILLGNSVGLKKDYEELRRFVLNSYKTMMKRGIKGLYLYIVDLELRNYLKTLF